MSGANKTNCCGKTNTLQEKKSNVIVNRLDDWDNESDDESNDSNSDYSESDSDTQESSSSENESDDD